MGTMKTQAIERIHLTVLCNNLHAFSFIQRSVRNLPICSVEWQRNRLKPIAKELREDFYGKLR